MTDTVLKDKNCKYKFAFLIHPRDKQDMFRKFWVLKYVPGWLITIIERFLPPVVVSSITGLKSQDGEVIEGYIISIPMTAPRMLKERDRAVKQIRKAVQLARSKGVKMVGLGALTSSLTHSGRKLTDISGISITTGHAYTGYNVTKTLLYNFRIGNINYTNPKCLVAIVGAAGSIGSISAELLANAGVKSLVLIDLDRKKESMKNLKKRLINKYKDMDIEYGSDMDLLKNAIGIITATNTPEALVKNKHITPGTIIVDDAQPSDISEELYDRKDVVVLEAGAVHTPGISSNMKMGLYNKFDNFSCLAEVLILASNKYIDNFVIDRVTFDKVRHIAKSGEKLGFSISKSQNQHGLVCSKKIKTVMEQVKKRLSA